MNIGGVKGMPQRIHGQERRITGFISEIILEFSAGELRTTFRLGSNKLRVAPVEQIMPHKGKSQTAEIAAATEASNHFVGIFARHLHLLFGFQTNDGLVQRYMVEHRTQSVFAVRRNRCQLDSF